MLEKLIIENVALIERAEIDFIQGLNVLSGETGAGKSVILDALNFVLGAKADKTLIKDGEEYCKVSAVFSSASNNKITELFNELEIELEEEILISRKFSIDGKSSIKLNGNTVTASMLKKLTCLLVDLHGQSEHYELLSNANQLKLIDLMGEGRINGIKSNLKSIFGDYKSVLKQIEELGGDQSQREIRLDLLNFQIKEIENANITDGEEEQLLEIRSKLNNQEKILNALSLLKSSLIEDNAVSDILNGSSRILSGISNYSTKYEELNQRLSTVIDEIDDIADCAQDFIEEAGDIEYNPQEIEDRLDLIKNIKRKYGSTFEEINNFLINAINEKEKLENRDVLYNELSAKKNLYEANIYNLYCILSDIRKEVAEHFIKKVTTELRELGMPNATFNIVFKALPNIEECKFNSSNGIDEIEFMFSANLGQPVKPLSNIISGGEISRFMLSIKAQSAKHSDVSTFVFDEIDAGISGLIALEVAKKFAKISKNVQIIAISHLPQISAMADNNLLIEKHELNNDTFTTVKLLDNQEKITEIMRLVGGVNSNSAKELAVELIDNSNLFKKSIS